MAAIPKAKVSQQALGVFLYQAKNGVSNSISLFFRSLPKNMLYSFLSLSKTLSPYGVKEVLLRLSMLVSLSGSSVFDCLSEIKLYEMR